MSYIAKYEAKIEAYMQQGKTKTEAVRTVAVKNPELHKDYLREFNSQFGRKVSA